MRPMQLNPRDRRALLLGLAVLVPVLFYYLALQPYLSALADTQEQLSVQRELLARELQLLREARLYPELMEQLERDIRSEVPRTFGDADGVTATAALAAHVSEQARRSRVHLHESESRDAETSDAGILTLRVGVRAMGDLEGILTFLHRLEQGERTVRVENLSLEPMRRSSFLEAEAEDVIALTASLAGYALVPVAAELKNGSTPPEEVR